MGRINKSASKIGTIQITETGAETTIYAGLNRNTGETQVWQDTRWPSGTRRVTRNTGKNVGALVRELDEVLNEGEGHWVGERDDDALDALRRYL